MSLVNDALKRAKEAQDKQAGSPLRGAPLHTAPPPPASKMWLVALVCFVLAIGGAGVGVWYWKTHPHPQWLQSKPDAPAKPPYTIIIGENPDAKARPHHAPTTEAPEAPIVTPAAKVVTIPAAPTPPPVAPVTKTESVPGALVVDKRPALNVLPPSAPAAVATTPVAPPVALKLQGILYSATKPAAILNGRTVFVGDVISGITITAIDQDSITITYSNQPTVIRMP
jgi:hypothetical protein